MSGPNSPVDGKLEDAVLGQALPVRFLPEAKNYATDESVCDWVRDNISNVVSQTRTDRQNLQEEWAAIRRMEMLKHDSGQKYIGRSNAYVPVFNRSSSIQVSTLSKGLFPSDDYMDVASRNEEDPRIAKAVKAYLQWEFEAIAQIRRFTKPFLRQVVNFGNGVLKYRYNRAPKYRGKVTQVARNILQPAFVPTNQFDGLSVSARSIFNVHVYPMTAESMAEATIVFEDIDVPLHFIEEQLRLKIWVNEVAARNAQRPAEMDYNREELFATRLKNTTTPNDGTRNPLGDIRCITEVWSFAKLPKSAYVQGEDPNCLLPVRIILCGDEPVLITRNPYWHQVPPYLFGRTNTEPGNFYGYGIGRPAMHLQYLTNDFANQTNDVGIYSLNPVALVNPGLLAGPMPALRPGVTIPVTDVKDALAWDRPPVELIQYGTGLFTMWTGMSQDFSGAPPILQGQAAGKTGKTATGAQLMQKNAMLPLQDVVEDLELDVLCPLMRGAWSNAQQYREEGIKLKVAGMPLNVNPVEVAGDWDFRWLASSQAINQQMRAQQAITLIQAVMPALPLLMQQGYIVDPAPLIRKIYSDGFGFRGFDEFIRKMTPQDMMQMGALKQAQNPQAPQEEQGDRIRSATEQIPGGGSGEMVPGEGEDFMEVRQGADEMAGGFGGMNDLG